MQELNYSNQQNLDALHVTKLMILAELLDLTSQRLVVVCLLRELLPK